MDTVSARPARHSVHLTLSEHTALNTVRTLVNESFSSEACSSALELGRGLAEKQLLVTLRTSLPHGFHSLKHQFLLVQTQLGGKAALSAFTAVVSSGPPPRRNPCPAVCLGWSTTHNAYQCVFKRRCMEHIPIK
jgi:hypothetical protein